ncbi:MAG: 2-oxoglutarate dehydrogenase E1 component [Bacteroidetes bacterium]|nr:2-oxoglutarate dehydrogenase E1 component [Bacteroidota bacterium]
MEKNSYLSNSEINFIENLYNQYKNNKNSVDFGWQKFFEGFEFASVSDIKSQSLSTDIEKEIKVLNLINYGYRTRGHLFTKTNPVRARRTYTPNLELENFGLSQEDLNTTFNAGIEIGIGPAKLNDIVSFLQKTYCNHIGVEFMYILNPEKKKWLIQKMESVQNTPDFDIVQKRRILEKLNQAMVFESFLHTKYVGQKRFSLEGLEGLIPAIDTLINHGAELGGKLFVIGMAHRGRLNVLTSILGKTYEEVFTEFEGKAYQDALFEGDVKYHLGYTSKIKTLKGKDVALKLSPNPSHLEAVNPVVEGMSRAELDNNYKNIDEVFPILIHGDASISGQGIVYETLQMSNLEAYTTGGTIHIVANNQIGFTTNYQDGRSSIYCTDIAKVTKCPVFHVNADYPEAIAYVIKLAVEYRQRYHEDIFIDLLGYRKYGHNEGDEPRFTQPLLYKSISTHPDSRKIYIKQLEEAGKIEAKLAVEMETEFRKMLQEKLDLVRKKPAKAIVKPKQFDTDDINDEKVKTSIEKNTLIELASQICHIPDEYTPINKIVKLFDERKKMVATGNYDWAMGELIAYTSLLYEGYNVRITGQDVERGTFSHRHAVIKKEDTELEYVPLQHIKKAKGKFEIYNSLLSEYAVLGFEYGYSITNNNTLTIWEAQFGDFFNGAQIVIDQFISSGMAKWKTECGLTMFLPHGYEGQGPEHSSARIERFLQMCASNNMTVAYPSTPSNLFHLLRLQIKGKTRKPLIVFTPKSLLRNSKCVSSEKDFTNENFKKIIDDELPENNNIERVLLCSGKIYYDLINFRENEKIEKIAIVRLEQYYPFPKNELEKIRKKYKKAKIIWVQEEPENMGAYTFLLRNKLSEITDFICRSESSSPATGFAVLHNIEQNEILKKAFGII